MAKVQEEVIVIRLSKLVKENGSNSGTEVTDEMLQTIESVAQELASSGVIVEVEKA